VPHAPAVSPALRLAAWVTALAIPLAACDRPVAPSYPLPDDAAQVAPAAELSLSSALAALPPDTVATIPGRDGAELRLAFDGARLVAEVAGAPRPSAICPVVLYAAGEGGSHRHELRFRGTQEAPQVLLNGVGFGGTAPRALADDHVLRGAVLTLGGDIAIHVVSTCLEAPLVPTVVAHLEERGGLRWALADQPTVVGVRGVTEDAPPEDLRRYPPGTPLTLVGHQLDALTGVRFGAATAPIREATPSRALVITPERGDTDTAVPLLGPHALPPIWLPVEGTIHRVGDAMDSLVSSVWGTWLVLLLVSAGLILTLVNGFPQFRGFRHAIGVIRGRYDNPHEQGEISHFQALTAALSATVGLGNIAGVAVAVTQGGPGALFWMWVCGFLGMATKYSECTLATATRDVREDGTVAGGPMYYMRKHLPRYLKPMGLVFALLIAIGSFGGGNMFQANQAAALWHSSFGVPTWVTGLILVVIVAMVIVGGIKRIGRVTDKLVPSMCGLYVLGAIAVIVVNIDRVPWAFGMIFSEAFAVSSIVGGALGIAIKDVLIQGFRRAAFSNEAGLGSAAIAHAAVKTDEPVREGVVALLEPFIDTIVICTMTGLVVILSGLWTQQGLDGAPLTAAAFDSVFAGFGSILIPIAVFLFAISTMISWSYYGEKGVEFIFGRRAVMPYKILFVGLVFVGAVWKLGPVLDFSDAMIGLIAVPNLIAVLILTPRLRSLTRDYFGRLRSGEMRRFK